MMCRPQSYDNAATVAGIHEGVQAILNGKNNVWIIRLTCVVSTLFAESASCMRDIFWNLRKCFLSFVLPPIDGMY